MATADPKVIDTSKEYDCRYWSDRFRISTDELKQAVEAAGPRADDVARYLDKGAEEVAVATAGREATSFARKKAQEARQIAEWSTDEVMKFIGARPVASVLIGAAVGYLLGRIARR